MITGTVTYIDLAASLRRATRSASLPPTAKPTLTRASPSALTAASESSSKSTSRSPRRCRARPMLLRDVAVVWVVVLACKRRSENDMGPFECGWQERSDHGDNKRNVTVCLKRPATCEETCFKKELRLLEQVLWSVEADGELRVTAANNREAYAKVFGKHSSHECEGTM